MRVHSRPERPVSTLAVYDGTTRTVLVCNGGLKLGQFSISLSLSLSFLFLSLFFSLSLSLFLFFFLSLSSLSVFFSLSLSLFVSLLSICVFLYCTRSAAQHTHGFFVRMCPLKFVLGEFEVHFSTSPLGELMSGASSSVGSTAGVSTAFARVSQKTVSGHTESHV